MNAAIRRLLPISACGVRLSVPPDCDAEILRSLKSGGYEAAEIRIVRDIVRPGDRVLDIGAALGVVGLAAAKAGALVRMFEANPALIPFAVENLRRAGFTAEIERAAVVPDNFDGEDVTFNVHAAFWSSSMEQRAGKTTEIRARAVRISDAIEAFRPDVLIVDVEGSECDLLRSPLPGVRDLVVEMHARVTGRERQREMIADLFGRGFTLDLERSSGEVLTFTRR